MIAIDSLVSAFETGRLTRRQLVQGLAALVGAATATDAAAQAPAIPAPVSYTHLTLPTSDLV